MYIEYTESEIEKIRQIQEKAAPELIKLSQQIEKAKGQERANLLRESNILQEKLRENLAKYADKLQRQRFKKITGGADGIIENAREQSQIILELIYKKALIDCEDLTPEAIKELRYGTLKEGILYVNSNSAVDTLKTELKLHLEALQNNEDAFKELLGVIIEAVENSPYTDNEEILDITTEPLNIMRFRRNPLKDITSYGILNDKANAQLLKDPDIFKQRTDGQLTLKWVTNQMSHNREAVPVYMALSYEGNDYKITKQLTAYDKQVYEAVATRFYYWNRENPQKPLYISPQEIWRTMNGKSSKDGKAKANATQINKICESLDKMRFTRFYMDISQEISKFNLSINDDRVNSGYIETYVLNSSKVEFMTDKGNKVSGYRIGEEPILYTYNKAKNHVLYVPYEMLDTSQYTSDTENVAEFKGYLLQQIQLMKNAAEQGKKGNYFKRSNTILLNTIYEETGTLSPEERAENAAFTSDKARQTYIRKTRKADRNKIESLLDAWKDKQWISDYIIINSKNEPIKEKQQAKGYKIIL